VNDIRAWYINVVHPDTLALTEEDYDALHHTLQHDMPRVHRDLLPRVLRKLTQEGVIEISVSGTEITVRLTGYPDSPVVRVSRTGALQ